MPGTSSRWSTEENRPKPHESPTRDQRSVTEGRHTVGVTDAFSWFGDLPSRPQPTRVSERTLRDEVEAVLIGGYTRVKLEMVLTQELQIAAPSDFTDASYKRDLVQIATAGWSMEQLIELARRIVEELDARPGHLGFLIAEYDRTRSGVSGTVKNLIFAANGPKPEIVLRDAVSNDVEITRNAEYCLVYDRPIAAAGLPFQTLIDWWRVRESLGDDMQDRDVGLRLYNRLRASLGGNAAETVVFETYQRRYREQGFGIPALVPQVYLHYDPYTHRQRGHSGSPLPRQRMDFLLLYSDRRRVVIEVDGQQHYAESGAASPRLYAQMAAEDRRLRLAGYEVYRFGGYELLSPGADQVVAAFFTDLHDKMTTN